MFEVYSGKCFYTTVALDIASFHIEHIIPESMGDDPKALKELLQRLDLPETFDIFGYENLVPTAPNANMKKGDALFSDTNIRFYLSLVKKDEVLNRIELIKTTNNKMKLVVMLKGALESGKLTWDEVAAIADQSTGDPEETFHLIHKLKFFDDTEIEAIMKSDIESLRDRPVRMGENTFIDGLTLTHNELPDRHVRTTREYDDAVAVGYYGYTTYAMKMEAFFIQQSGLLHALEKASIPKSSFIASPRVGLTDLHLLPLDLFPRFGESGFDETTGLTYQDKLNEGAIRVLASRHNYLKVDGPMGQQLIEVVRADFTGDGLEDILLFTYRWAIGGTFGHGGVAILSRKTSDGPFELSSI